jgi:protein-arginine kinase activator protein McsA
MREEEENRKIIRMSFHNWIFEHYLKQEEEFVIKQQIKKANKKRLKANKKRLKAVKKENYLEAAKYRDIIKNLKR